MDEAEFPESFLPVVRRLHEASKNPNVRNEMEMEDCFVEEFRKWGKLIEEQKENIEKKENEIERLNGQLSELQGKSTEQA